MKHVAAALLVGLMVGGCGGTTWINKKYKDRVDPKAERVLLMPVVAHRFPPAMRAEVEKLVFGELANRFGHLTVSVFPVKDKLEPSGFGNLSWHIAQGVYRRGRYAKDPDIRGEYYDWLDDLPGHATKFLKWIKGALAEAGAAPGGNASYRYIMAIYVELTKRAVDKKLGKVIHFRVVGGVYDAQESRIVAATWLEYRTKPTMAAVRRKLTGVGKRLRVALRPVLQ